MPTYRVTITQQVELDAENIEELSQELNRWLIEELRAGGGVDYQWDEIDEEGNDIL